MTLSASLSPIILDTVLSHLALIFLTSAAGDHTVARQAASQMLAAYRPETEAELSLAAEVISFSFQALEALSQAATSDMPLTKVLRLRGSAVSLSREAHKFQRKLDEQQKARAAMSAAECPSILPESAISHPHTSPAPVRSTRPSSSIGARHQGQTWTQAFQQRQTAKRITENLKKNQAAHSAMPTPAANVAAQGLTA